MEDAKANGNVNSFIVLFVQRRQQKLHQANLHPALRLPRLKLLHRQARVVQRKFRRWKLCQVKQHLVQAKKHRRKRLQVHPQVARRLELHRVQRRHLQLSLHRRQLVRAWLRQRKLVQSKLVQQRAHLPVSIWVAYISARYCNVCV